MKKIFLLGLVASLITISIISCDKEETNNSKPDLIEHNNNFLRKSNTLIDENNIGEHHNAMIDFIFNDLSKMSTLEINNKIATSSYSVIKMKEYCELNSIKLPSDEELNLNFVKFKTTTIEDLLNNEVFSIEQKNILTECFTSLDLINNDLTKNELLLSILNNNLNIIKSHNESTGKRIAIATINQMIASDKLWIIEDRINFLNINNSAKTTRPTNGQVLAADAKGVVIALIAGGWSSPIGWCGTMFVGAGVSIGAYMGNPLWWPF